MADIDVKLADQETEEPINEAVETATVAEPGSTVSPVAETTEEATPEAPAEPETSPEAEAAPAEPEAEAEAAPELPAEEAAPEPESAPEPEAPAEPAAPEVPTESVPETPAETAPVANAPAEPKKPKEHGSKHILMLVIDLILVAIIIALAAWGYGLMQDNDKLKAENAKLNSNPAIVAQKQSEATLTAVGKLTTLPTGENPTVADVSDASKAKAQSAFFVNAQNGDKVLLYPKAGIAILYRPSTGKIVLKAPLTFTDSSATSSTTTKPKQ